MSNMIFSNIKYDIGNIIYDIRNLLKPLKIRYFLFFSFISEQCGAVEGEFFACKKEVAEPLVISAGRTFILRQ